MKLYEILVPTEMVREGMVTPIRTRYHRVWDERVRDITGGLTILTPTTGQWVSPSGELFCERMIPVRIVCSPEQIEQIADMTAAYYNQEAVLFVEVGEATIRLYPDNGS